MSRRINVSINIYIYIYIYYMCVCGIWVINQLLSGMRIQVFFDGIQCFAFVCFSHPGPQLKLSVVLIVHNV